MGRDAAEVLRAVTGTTITINPKEEKIDMCKGEEQMKQRAFEAGEQTGFAKGILGTVNVLKDLQFTVEQIREKLMQTYALTADEAMKYIVG